MSHSATVGSVPGRTLLVTLLLLTLTSLAAAQIADVAITTEEEITVDAGSVSYDQQLDAITATGNVVIRRGAVELRADEVRLSRKTNEAEAIGNVTLSDPEGILFSERMQIDLNAETGELRKAKLHGRRQPFSLAGDLIRKGIGQSYHIENGLFTTCACESGRPSWSIGADTVDVTLEGSAVLKDARFHVADVPLLCLPRAWLPVTRERQSGLLVPRVGFSNRRGLQFLQPVYWAINKNEDATLALDIESSARLGLVGEYRYAVSKNFQGTLGASYFNEAIRGLVRGVGTSVEPNPDVPENRWSLTTEHTQRLGSVEAYADLLLVGDDLFLREINTFAFDYESDIGLRTRPFTDSRFGFVQRWNRLTLHTEGVFFQDLVQDDALVLQRAPEVRLFGQKQLGAGLLGRLDSSLTDFLRQRGIDGIRADLAPGVEVRLPLGPSFTGAAYATFRETAYHLTENEMRGGFRGDNESPDAEIVELPRYRSRESVELGAYLGTAFSRVFPFGHLGIEKVKHVVEPRLEYFFIPAVSQDDVMVFDGLDRLDERSLLTYGFSSRLLGRTTSAGRNSHGGVVELTRFSVSQSVDLDRTLPSSTRSTLTDSLSDIDFALRVQPVRNVAVRGVLSFDPASASFSATSVGLRLLEPLAHLMPTRTPDLLRRSSVAAAYRFVTNDPLRNALSSLNMKQPTGMPSEGIQEFDPILTLPLNERFAFRYASRYNIRNASFLENHFGLRLVSACNCWSVDVGLTDKENPNEVEFRAQISLLGLGSTAVAQPFGLQ